MAKHGLIITYYFPPLGGGGVQRWSKFVKYLSNYDWQFDIITQSHSSKANIDNSLLKDLPESLNVYKIQNKTAKEHFDFFNINSSYLQRYIAAFFFPTDTRKSWVNAAWSVVCDKINSSNYDIIICSIPPYSISDLAVKIKNKYCDIPVVLDMRDPWSINPYKIYPTFIHELLDKKKEIQNLKQLDNIISAYKSILDNFSERLHGFRNKNSIVITNGYDDEDFTDLQQPKLTKSGSFNIAFSGTFYSHLNNPKMLFKAIKELIKEGYNISFHHIGTSVHDVKSLAIKYGIEDNIVLWGYKDHSDCLQILHNMDAFVLILDSKFKNADKTIGGKVYEYLKFNKPILALVPENGEAADLIAETNSGVICDSSDTMIIKANIKKIQNKSFQYVGIDQYRRDILAIKLNQYLNDIISINKNE